MWAGLAVAALLVHGVTLVGTGNVLAKSLGHYVPQDSTGAGVLEFEMVDEPTLAPDDDEPTIVEQHAFDRRRPDESDRVAEVDSNPDRETKAGNQPDQGGGAPSVQGDASQPSQPTQGRPQPSESSQPSGQGTQAEGHGPGEQLGAQDQALHDAADGREGMLGGEAAAREGETATPLPPSLGGSVGALHNAFGPRGTHDDLRDVDEGETNVLKSKRHIYASFFNRLRDRVSEHWDPEAVHRKHDPQQRIYGTKARTTVLWVKLDTAGAIVALVIKKSSGADHLDEEAVRAIRAAAPFPNPPEGLFDSDDTIGFDFGFTLDFIEGPRIFRYTK